MGIKRKRMSIKIFDDNPESCAGLVQRIEKQNPEWSVEVSDDRSTARDDVSENTVISVDLDWTPGGRDDPSEGLKLLNDLRNAHPQAHLVVHSAIDVKHQVLKQILLLGASYFRTRIDADCVAYAQSVPLIAKGYLVLSGSAAITLKELMDRENPLEEAEWQILRLWKSHSTIPDIANSMHISEPTVHARIKQIHERLVRAKFVTPTTGTFSTSGNVYKKNLLNFYDEFADRFGE